MIETERLILRGWRRADRTPFHRLSSEPEVARYLGPPPTRADSDAAIDRQIALQARQGHCFWAIERKADARLIGFCGLKPGPSETSIADDIEIGWRLGRPYWGEGYAREAAEASLAWGWDELDAPRIASITVTANVRSWRLMERLGMTRRPELDFLHPALADGDPLKPHIAYIMERPC